MLIFQDAILLEAERIDGVHVSSISNRAYCKHPPKRLLSWRLIVGMSELGIFTFPRNENKIIEVKERSTHQGAVCQLHTPSSRRAELEM